MEFGCFLFFFFNIVWNLFWKTKKIKKYIAQFGVFKKSELGNAVFLNKWLKKAGINPKKKREKRKKNRGG